MLPEQLKLLPERVKNLRESRGYSQRVLAGMLGVSQQTIAGWERSRTSPDRRMVSKMVGIFGVTSDYLLGISDSRHGEASEKDRAYLEMARTLREYGITPEELEVIMGAHKKFMELTSKH
ncbi:MAG: helix-turn-helix domain-containing protein [Oscillospiraceae bacterium]|jgi:transcriptional regulator with XRE-family HTH domain|nr:helix-turn-helix domain-containing protein [Oscillospiraceae bacterium]